MKKALLITLSLIIIIILFLLYQNRYSEHALEESNSCAHIIGTAMHNILYKEEIYNNVSDSFVISSYDNYTDHSEIGTEIKNQLDSQIISETESNSSIGYLHPEKYEYYIEVKGKEIQSVVCSKSRNFSNVGSYLNSYNAGRKNMNKVVDELYSNFISINSEYNG